MGKNLEDLTQEELAKLREDCYAHANLYTPKPFKVDNGISEYFKYENTNLKKMADEISQSQDKVNKTLLAMNKNSNLDRKINIVILLFAFLSLVVAVISLYISINSNN